MNVEKMTSSCVIPVVFVRTYRIYNDIAVVTQLYYQVV